MKTIDIPVQVPEWVTCVTQDWCGDWRGHEIEPTANHVHFAWDSGGRTVFISGGESNPNWRETLREVE